MKKIIARFNENTTQTLNVKEMVGMYLAENVIKLWQEDFADEETGEIVSVERTEVLFSKGTLVTNDLASRIQFSIDAEEITKPIMLTNVNRKSQLYALNSYRPIMVHISTGLAKPWILLWADSFVHAMEVASDYMEQISNDGFSIFEIKNLGATLVDRDEFYEKQEKQAFELDITLNPLRYYVVDVIWKESGTPYPFVNPSREAKDNLHYGTFVTMAESLDEAKEILCPEISRIALKENGLKSIEIHWEKGKPFSPSIIVPKHFCDEYNEHYKTIK